MVDDNVMGDKYNIDVEVEPDLGGLIANLTTANELLDDAATKFGAIADVVATTTQKVVSLTGATRQFVTETARIKSEYQQIASITGPWNAGAQIPGYAPNISPQAVAQSLGPITGVSGGTGGLMPTSSPPTSYSGPLQPSAPAGYGRATQFNQARELGQNALKVAGHWDNPNQDYSQNNPLAARLKNAAEVNYQLTRGQPVDQAGANYMESRIGDATETAGELFQTRVRDSFSGLSPEVDRVADGSASAADRVTAIRQISGTKQGGSMLKGILKEGLMQGGVEGSLLTKAGTAVFGESAIGAVSSTVASVAGPIAAVVAAAAAAKKLQAFINERAKSAQAYGALTGGTDMVQATKLDIQKVKESGEFMGFDFNPLISRENVDEMYATAMAAGYNPQGKGAGRFAESKDYMTTITKTGMMGIGDQFDLYQKVVAEGGAGIGSLTSSLLSLRQEAQNTGKSLQIMTANFKANVSEYMKMGASGTGALAAAQINAHMFANSANPNVKNFQGLDVGNSVYLQAQVAAGMGVSYGQLPGVMGQAGATTQMVALSHDAVRQRLEGFGIRKGMSPEEMNAAMGGNFMTIMQDPTMRQMLGVPDNISDPMDVLDWVKGEVGQTGADITKEVQEKANPKISDMNLSDEAKHDMGLDGSSSRNDDGKGFRHSKFYTGDLWEGGLTTPIGGATNPMQLFATDQQGYGGSTKDEKEKNWTYMMEEYKNSGLDLSTREGMNTALIGDKQSQEARTQALIDAGIDPTKVKDMNHEQMIENTGFGGYTQYAAASGTESIATNAAFSKGEQNRTLIRMPGTGEKGEGQLVSLEQLTNALNDPDPEKAKAAKIAFDRYRKGRAKMYTLNQEEAKSMEGLKSGTNDQGMTTYSEEELKKSGDIGAGTQWGTNAHDAATAAGSLMKSDTGQSYTKYGEDEGMNGSTKYFQGIEHAMNQSLQKQLAPVTKALQQNMLANIF